MKLEEKWYEGDFKKKYPNGVLCRVWNLDEESFFPYIRIVSKYDERSIYHFRSYHGNGMDPEKYIHAEPIKPEEAPAIIGGKDA